MKKNLLLLLFIPIISFSQNKTEAEIKVNEGIVFHDQGKYNEALNKYDEALSLDKNNLFALSEKAMTLETSQKYNEAIEICKLVINTYPDKDVKTVYISYANSLDHLKQTQEAIKIYDEGIKKYPNYYQLYFNKGIALINDKQVEKALESFQKAAKLKPNHKGSLNALAALNSENRIVSILCSLRYLALDNKSQLAKNHLKSVLTLMNKGVTQKDDNSINLSIDPTILDKANDKKSKNNFSSTDMVLSMTSALDFDEKNKGKTDYQRFTDKLDSMFATMEETQKKQSGFYWEFLAPYFIEMHKQKLIEPFTYIAFSAQPNDDIIKYYKDHSEQIEQFYKWSENYIWK
ncbi:tetratricopeptide repeat protein [Chryseobacterium sp. RG1]|uniref:Tetratricopeptide repeat protein n=1 Tax=Chryseobacterium tagetis TaxID=2801334 RepID=A0ABS7ZYX6_9FLAO|nr:tetratricopeptide repeat protein [Chryseobacterium tagetis]MCA6065671.1 tetratricopeptide repeat protein [Chryseobacterium tagetis]